MTKIQTTTKRKEAITMEHNDYFFEDFYFDDNFENGSLTSNMSDDFLKFAVDVYEDYLASVSEDDFIVNSPQMRKFIDIVNFFIKKARKNNIEIEPLIFSKKDCNAEVSVRGYLLDLYRKEIPEFFNLAKEATNITVECNLDNEVILTVLVCDVFKRKN